MTDWLVGCLAESPCLTEVFKDGNSNPEDEVNGAQELEFNQQCECWRHEDSSAESPHREIPGFEPLTMSAANTRSKVL